MMKKINNIIYKKILTILLFNIILLPLEASIDVKIITKINNEIITNVDVIDEYNYLTALNNDLKDLDKKSVLEIAKNSLIREKIKKSELEKHFNLNRDIEILESIIENFYTKLNLQNKDEFKNYLLNFDITLKEVENKIKIEVLWNQLIQIKFSKQININIEELKKKIVDEDLNTRLTTSYNLSEIVFEIQDNKDLSKIFDEINQSIISNGFNNTANKFSISDTSKFGGQIGWIKENQLSKKIINSLQSLNIGDYTKPIDIANGFLILKLLDKKGEKSLSDPKKILDNLISYETNRQFSEFSIMHFNKLKLNTSIVNE
jgi:peptidyl-prolyl cis-trans isomerase SurA